MNVLEELEHGKVDFIHQCPLCDYYDIIDSVRNSERRNEIIKGFLPLLIERLPFFCFNIICDMEEYSKETSILINKLYKTAIISKENLKLMLNNCSIGYQYLLKNFDKILTTYKDDLDFIFKYMFNNYNKTKDVLKILSIYPNTHIRFLFMNYLIQNHKDKILDFYPDITEFFTKQVHTKYEQLTFIPEYMDFHDISTLACTALEKEDIKLWSQIKEYILKYYETNDLAHLLLCKSSSMYSNDSLTDTSPQLFEQEFNKDANRLFQSSHDYRLQIISQRFSKKVSNVILSDYKKKISKFKIDGEIDWNYHRIVNKGLEPQLDKFVEKYLEKSKTDECSYIRSGSTASCYHIGDYAFKLVNHKWSSEEIICPDLYIILPNIEEIYIRDNNNSVTGGIEVQKYLRRSAKQVPREILSLYIEELERLGYYITDNLMNGTCGDNCRLLDSYKDACSAYYPEWFKKYPLVLVDRDMVYKIKNSNPLQFKGYY